MDKKKTIDVLNALLTERNEALQVISELPKGYIQMKTVSGHRYAFRQWREGDKVKSVYVNENYVSVIERKIQLRKSYSKLVKEINAEIKKVGKDAIKKGVLTEKEFEKIISDTTSY